MRVLDLFSGIGGFSLGLERTGGFQTVAFCEIDPFCRRVLAKHWPGVPIHEDVRMLRGEDVGPVDVVCGGFPCQPFSSAGKRGGTSDDRWLWPEMRRLIQELRPAWVIGENVTHIDRMGLETVLADLAADSYQTAPPFEIPACAVDLDHLRFRTWLVGYTDRQGEPTRAIHDGAPRLPSNDADAERGRIALGRDVAGVGWQREQVSRNTGRLAQDRPRRVGEDDVVPNRMDQLRALGNAVVPQIPEIIGRAILTAEAAHA
jgi:DNA (cytosine-5)-methyltransferase 1